jgi:hypothetical protein
MTMERDINQLLLPICDFEQAIHRLKRYTRLDVSRDSTLHNWLFDMLRRGSLTCTDVSDFNDEQYAAIIFLLSEYRAYLSANPHLLGVVAGTAAEALSQPLVREMSKGWPANPTPLHFFYPQFIRPETEI